MASGINFTIQESIDGSTVTLTDITSYAVGDDYTRTITFKDGYGNYLLPDGQTAPNYITWNSGSMITLNKIIKNPIPVIVTVAYSINGSDTNIAKYTYFANMARQYLYQSECNIYNNYNLRLNRTIDYNLVLINTKLDLVQLSLTNLDILTATFINSEIIKLLSNYNYA